MSQGEVCNHTGKFNAQVHVVSSPERLSGLFEVRCVDCGSLMHVDTSVLPKTDQPRLTAELQFLRPAGVCYRKVVD